MNEYTVHDLASIANISVRTLHHYDGIGLLKPTRIGDNGYRYYGQNELVTLMRILLYKELDFSLGDISNLLHRDTKDQVAALMKQKEMLKMKDKKIRTMIQTVDLVIGSLQAGKTIDTKKLSVAFDNKDIETYGQEAAVRWGHTDAYRQSVERSRKWTQQDMKRIKHEGSSITLAIAGLKDKAADDPDVQKPIARHHRHINTFYDCTIKMYRGLGNMYFDDPRFARTYNSVKPGLAKFMKEAIQYYCDAHAITGSKKQD